MVAMRAEDHYSAFQPRSDLGLNCVDIPVTGDDSSDHAAYAPTADHFLQMIHLWAASEAAPSPFRSDYNGGYRARPPTLPLLSAA